MGKHYFTDKEVEVLKENKYVRKVSNKAITYTDDFKTHVVTELNFDKSVKEIFIEAGFDINVIGDRRIYSSSSRWKKDFNQKGVMGLRDTRIYNQGAPRLKERTLEEQNKFLMTKIKYLEGELDTIKKFEEIERRQRKTNRLLTSEKYEIINKLSMTNLYTISHLIVISNVSKSGYYNYISEKSRLKRQNRKVKEAEDIKIISSKFNEKGFKKGSRQIRNQLKNENIIMNLKKIQRIMRQNNLEYKPKRSNAYKKILSSLQEDSYAPNLVQRKFKSYKPGELLLTDITYINYSTNSRAYLSTIKDATTNQIVGYKLSDSMKIDFVIDSLEYMFTNENFSFSEKTIIHSDQGAHYTSKAYRNYLQKNNMTRSMSRRGNCWDNAPMESFFGRMKSETNFECIKNIQDLNTYIDSYINYHNTTRVSETIKNMTPNDYRSHVLNI